MLKLICLKIVYASVGTVDNGYVPDISSTNPSLVMVNFEEADIISAIKKLKPNSSGSDKLPSLLFQKTGALPIVPTGNKLLVTLHITGQHR